MIESAKLIFAFVVLAVFLAIPLLFIGTCLKALFYSSTRQAIRRHKVLYTLWALASLFCLFALTYSGPSVETARRAKTQNTIGQIFTAIENYRIEYDSLPSATENAALIKELSENNSQHIAFISLKPRDFNDHGEALDAWGTPIRISVIGSRIEIRSAGPDRKFDTKDDLVGESSKN